LIVVDKTGTRGVYAQANELVSASYSMPVACHRLLALALTQLSYGKGRATLSNYTVVITGRRYREVFEHGDSSNAYRELAGAANTMQTTKAAVVRVPCDRGYTQKAWFSEVAYLERSGCVIATFSPAIRCHLTDLWSDFTVMELEHLKGFRSRHSFRLYMLLRQFRSTGVRIETPERLQELFGVTYTRYSNFKAKVLLVALQELSESGIRVSMKEHRAKRTVARVEFKFRMAT
jgi:plasmid replication initiation protein